MSHYPATYLVCLIECLIKSLITCFHYRMTTASSFYLQPICHLSGVYIEALEALFNKQSSHTWLSVQHILFEPLTDNFEQSPQIVIADWRHK